METYTLVSGHHIKLQCRPDSNLARVSWRFSGGVLRSDDKHYVYDGGLLVLNASSSDAGRYTCDSVEQVAGRPYTKTVAAYEVRPRTPPSPPPTAQPDEEETVKEEEEETTEPPTSAITPAPGQSVRTRPMDPPLTPQSHSDAERLVGLKVAVVLLTLLLAATLAWNLKGRCRRFLPQKAGAGQGKAPSSDYVDSNRTTGQKLLPSASSITTTTNAISTNNTITANSKNNNHAHVDILRNGEHLFSGRHVSSPDGLGFINDESEI